MVEQSTTYPALAVLWPAWSQSTPLSGTFLPLGEWWPDVGIGHPLHLWYPPWFSLAPVSRTGSTLYVLSACHVWPHQALSNLRANTPTLSVSTPAYLRVYLKMLIKYKLMDKHQRDRIK